MFETLVSTPGPVAFHFLVVSVCLYCHLSKKLLPGSLMREEMSLKVRRQTSSLVFIFIFYISLNVQPVSCSIVSLYTYVSIFIWFHISCSSIIECSYYAFVFVFFGTQLIAICLLILLIMY